MDNFVRVEKRISPSLRTAASKRGEPDASAPPIPDPVDWHFVTSERAKHLHVQSLSAQQMEQILRLFDVNPSYGPFVGIDRLLRWRRAENAGLHPPPLVKSILDTGNTASYRKAGRLW